jgi:hypothetical protein
MAEQSVDPEFAEQYRRQREAARRHRALNAEPVILYEGEIRLNDSFSDGVAFCASLILNTLSTIEARGIEAGDTMDLVIEAKARLLRSIAEAAVRRSLAIKAAKAGGHDVLVDSLATHTLFVVREERRNLLDTLDELKGNGEAQEGG